MRYSADAIAAATRAMCRELYGDSFDLHDHGAQDPEGRASLERGAEAAVEAYLGHISLPTTKQIAEALCAADSILSLLHYRHRNELSERNRVDVEDAMDKVTAMRGWYEPQLRV